MIKVPIAGMRRQPYIQAIDIGGCRICGTPRFSATGSEVRQAPSFAGQIANSSVCCRFHSYRSLSPAGYLWQPLMSAAGTSWSPGRMTGSTSGPPYCRRPRGTSGVAARRTSLVHPDGTARTARRGRDHREEVTSTNRCSPCLWSCPYPCLATPDAGPVRRDRHGSPAPVRGSPPAVDSHHWRRPRTAGRRLRSAPHGPSSAALGWYLLASLRGPDAHALSDLLKHPVPNLVDRLRVGLKHVIPVGLPDQLAAVVLAVAAGLLQQP